MHRKFDRGDQYQSRSNYCLAVGDRFPTAITAKENRIQPRDYDRDLYKARHYLIENFFARLKQYRGIATRYDQRAVNFLGAIYLAAAAIWLN